MSIETNPNHLDPVALERYRDAGVTRLSVGVQSFDDGLLAGMDRLEKYGSGAVIRERLAAASGVFPTLNVDMIFNLPGQTLAMLERDLDIAAASCDVDQVSFYPLMTAPTARHKMRRAWAEADDRCDTRCTSAMPRPAAAGAIARRRRGASRAATACSTSTSSTRTTTSASAAARSVTWAARCTRRRSRSTTTAAASRAARAASRSGARSG